MDARNTLKVTYKAHHLYVEATKQSMGWSWSYLVEGHIRGVGKNGALPGADAALKEGISAAKACVDEMRGAGHKRT